MSTSRYSWQLPDRQLTLGARPLVMGIVNVTPDSFSDGGRFLAIEAAVEHALRLLREGADLLDLGGESTRPGAAPVPLEEELRRVLPVVTELARQTSALLSVDTSKAEVARQCLQAGAHIVNDVTALAGDPDMRHVLQAFPAGIILMHMQGTPATMQQRPTYDNVVTEIVQFFQERLQLCARVGISKERIALDPGIGFGKTEQHNWQILAQLEKLQALGRPLCLGVSRKSFIGKLLNRPVEGRLIGSTAILCHAMARQRVQIIRVHDVAETVEAVRVWAAIEKQAEGGGTGLE
ncbi:MAG: dihydropteroate synthase [Gemmataceae bacterium]